ncbi:MAG: FecR domain-containing protein [Odoribacteraceae bacterium]|jgi:ferric-dicitrate binding protein FerR (iron transport regulator)|nr:FecR domain-containing protein [Odoribacteraceae bacterium]
MEHVLFRLAGALAARFTGNGTREDDRVIEEWVDGDERRDALVRGLADKRRFEAHVEEIRSYPARAAWERARSRVTRGRRLRRVLYPVAAATLLAGAMMVFFPRGATLPATGGEESLFSSGTTGARLALADGRVMSIDKETTLLVTERDGTTIVVDSGGMDYRGDGDATAGVVYNEVSTPTGMEFPLTLSDGTRVYLNAESRLRFPVRFTGATREVELTGEAFFEVKADAERPFAARAGGVVTLATGTSFNTRAYESERSVVTTLVEGRVALVDGERRWEIAPGEQGRYVKATGECDTRPVDAGLYTAWRSGKFIFRNERLEDMLSYLSRWYGFEYEFHDEEARDVKVGANLDRYRDMEPIIRMLHDSRLARVVRSGNKLEVYSE